jgi:MFS family permease
MSASAVVGNEAGSMPFARPWLLVAVLTFCYLVSTIDRFVIGLLIQPISHSLHLTDVQISLLIGIAFTLFYSTFGLFVGRLVDRHDRRRVILIGVATWTAATGFTAFAWGYASLLLARMIVGLGEAALGPSAYSLIADIFPRRKLSRPTTFYFLGGSIGPGIALVFGGLMLAWAERLDATHLLGFLGNEPWRFVMLAAAVPGIAAILAVFAFVRDPRRGHGRGAAAALATGTLLGELRAKPMLYFGLLVGTSAVSIYINGLAAWWPTHALRTFDWPLQRSGVLFGIALAAGALSGILVSGSIGTRLMRRFGDAGNGIALTALSVVGVIPLAGAPLIADADGQLVAVGVAIACAFAVNGLAPVGCQLAAGPEMRGRVSALYVASTTIVGAGFGPFTVATLSGIDFGHGPIGLGGAIALTGLACSAVMIAAYGAVIRTTWKPNDPAQG